MAWHKIYAEDVMTAEPLHEVASKYIECLLTVQPASIAHVGLVLQSSSMMQYPYLMLLM